MKHLIFLTLAIGSLFTFVHAAWGGPFTPSSVVPISNGFGFVTTGDINGDGKPDLVSANNNDSFDVATNAGNGIFVSNATYSVGGQIHSIAVADINGDGKPDIILANNNNNTVIIFTNAGGGILVSNASYSVGNNPQEVLAQDINGDGKPDIITADGSGGTLTVLTNAGGTFPVAHTFVVVNANSFPQSFAIADINGDGKPDLIAGDQNDDLIEVLTNAGGGIFVSNAVYATGIPADQFGPAWLVAADFNNDGKMDIACGNLDTIVNVFTNAGNGILAQSQSFTPHNYANEISYIIVAADVDGDGHTDLLIPDKTSTGTALMDVVYNSGSGGIFITNFLNNANTVNMVTPNFQWTAAADINGDGKPDLIGTLSGFYIYTNGIGAFPNNLIINVYTNTSFAPVTNIVVNATSPSGAVVNFITTATNWTGSWLVTNSPPSGSTFPIGTTTVTATTGYHLTSVVSAHASTTFTVTVTVPPLGVGTAPGNQVALYWPGMNATNYVVQMTTNLTSGNWVNVTNSTPLTGISISNALPAAFFRLQPQ